MDVGQGVVGSGAAGRGRALGGVEREAWGKCEGSAGEAWGKRGEKGGG
jgi:hypothetical protein